DLNRDINAAATEVQSAINAARSQLPSGMPNNPTYRKVNPADAPIMVLTLTSDSMTRGQMYDWASTVVAQKLSQVRGVGQVTVGGSALPAVRAELNPTALNAYGIGLTDVRNALAAANANRPKGLVESGERVWWIYANDQAQTAAVRVSIIATFGFMSLAGYSLNNLSLMALIVATGFVVDDAIVVLENATRHIEAGMAPMQAALTSAKEVGFTVVSMSISLIAV